MNSNNLLIASHYKAMPQINVYYYNISTSIAGVKLVPEGSWKFAPKDAIICGVKELPQSTEPIKHRHIYFAHAFKVYLLNN